MKSEHPTHAELERYVMGISEPDESQRVEEHVALCEECSRSLADEARVEVALREAIPPKPMGVRETSAFRRIRRRRVAGVLGVALVAATFIVTMAIERSRLPTTRAVPSSNIRVAAIEREAIRIECGARNESAEKACRHQARCQGELVEDSAASEVPNYESLLGECKRAPGLQAHQRPNSR